MTRRRWLLGAGIAACLSAGQARAQTTAEGIRVLAREKSLAEQFMVMLNEFGRTDIGQYAYGVMLYAGAKAEFDGLISELEHELEQPRPPDQSAAFQTALTGAVKRRMAFTDFVSQKIVPKSPGTAKGIGDFIKVVPELVKALTDAGVSIFLSS